MNKALILVLDNTLITTLSRQKYALHSEDWKFILPTVKAVKDYTMRGYRVCIICNQPAIANNITPEKAFIRKMELIVKTLEKDLKIRPNSISYSYCIDEESYHWLPKPGTLYELALDFELDLYNSVLIGSNPYDKSTAILAGVNTYINVTDLKEEV